MSASLEAEPVPLSMDSSGALRVAKTRVTLETVVAAFEAGATPEEIVQDFPVLQLADVYATLTYCLRHPQDLREYLDSRSAQADEVREKIAARYDQSGLKDRLLARTER